MDYQNLKFLQDSLYQTQHICAWSLTPELQLLYSNCPEQEFFYKLFSVSHSYLVLREHFNESSLPLIVSDSIGFAWIAALQRPDEDGQIPLIQMLGPLFTSEMTEQYLEQHIHRIHPIAETADRLRRFVKEVPIITSELASSFAVMLHFCVRGETVKPADVELWSEPSEAAEDVEWGDANWHGTWIAEQRFFQSVSEGRAEGIRELASGKVGKLGGDPLRQAKNEMIVFTVLCSRAAILGGVSSEGALNLSDFFVQRIEASETVSSVRSLGAEIHRRYIQRVQKAQANQNRSALVRACMEYIETHIFDKISLKDMAAEIGYTETYISRKFKSETGESLIDAVNRQKTALAKSILKETPISVSELSDRLGFASPSYFSSVFRKYAGVTPVEYQNNQEDVPHAEPKDSKTAGRKRR